MGGTSQTTQSSTTAPTAAAAAAYSQGLGSAQNLANTAYNPLTNASVAGLTGPQTTAFGQLGSQYGVAQPYINSATGYANAAANPNTVINNIPGFENPYTQSVINSTLATKNQQDQMQQQQLQAGAASQGALGGDRLGVAQGVLGGQQALATNQLVSGLNSANYSQALAAAQQNAAQQGQAAYTLGNLGQEQLGTNITGAQAGLSAGNQLQQQAQNVANVGTQNAIQQTQWPYQNTQYLASIAGALGPLLGGTSSGTSTTPVNYLGQILGGGLAGLGLASKFASGGKVSAPKEKQGVHPIGKSFDGQTIIRYHYEGDPAPRIGLVPSHHPHLKDGGAAFAPLHQHFDTGGSVFNLNGMPLGMQSPLQSALSPARPNFPALPQASGQQNQNQNQQNGFMQQATQFGQMANMGSSAGSGLSKMNNSLGNSVFGDGVVSDPSAMGTSFTSGLGGLFADGGTVRRGYDEGGEVTPYVGPVGEWGDVPVMPAKADPWAAKLVDTASAAPMQQPAAQPIEANLDGRDPTPRSDSGAMASMFMPPQSAAAPVSPSGGIDTALAPPITDLTDPLAGGKPLGTPSDGTNPSATPQPKERAALGRIGLTDATGSVATPAGRGILAKLGLPDTNPLGLNNNQRNALMMAGFSMMAAGPARGTKSPIGSLTTIGTGAVAGMNTYLKEQEQEKLAAAKAKELAQQAEIHRSQLAETSRHNKATESYLRNAYSGGMGPDPTNPDHQIAGSWTRDENGNPKFNPGMVMTGQRGSMPPDPARVREAQWLVAHGVAPDLTTAYGLVHSGVNDAATFNKAVQAEKNRISNSVQGMRMSDVDQESLARKNIVERAALKGAQLQQGATTPAQPAPNAAAPAAPKPAEQPGWWDRNFGSSQPQQQTPQTERVPNPFNAQTQQQAHPAQVQNYVDTNAKNFPPGSQFNKRLNLWRDPQGNWYDAQGNRTQAPQ